MNTKINKTKKYDIGSIINGEWIIVAILQIKKQNKKILCYHLNKKIFLEGWIWDFTRDIVNPNKQNINPLCKIVYFRNTGDELENILDINQEYEWIVSKKTKYLSNNDRYILESIRCGYLGDVQDILNKFDLLLKTSGHARRNMNLGLLIMTTYNILTLRNYWLR